jgi:hypothetical protein
MNIRTRLLPAIAFVIWLLLPCVAYAQPQIDPALVDRYLNSVEEIETRLTWETAGRSRELLNAERLVVEATWRRSSSGGPPVLVSAKIEAVGRRLEIPGTGRRIRRLILKPNGHLGLRQSALVGFDIRVSVEDGGLVLHLPLWKKARFSKEQLGVAMTQWPPTLSDMIALVTAPRATAPSAEAQHEGRFTWEVRSKASAFAFPLNAAGSLEASSTMELSGEGTLSADGRFSAALDNDRNRVEIVAAAAQGHFQTTRATPTGTQGVTASVREGRVAYSGSYGLQIRPKAPRFRVSLSGELDYALALQDVNTLHDGRGNLALDWVELSGRGRVTGGISKADRDLVLSDGEFALDASGPVRSDGYQAGRLRIGKSDSRVDLSVRGRTEHVGSDGYRLAVASARGHVQVGSAGGIAGRLLGEPGGEATRFTVEPGSETRIDLKGTVSGTRGQAPRIDASGKVKGALSVSDASLALGGHPVGVDRLDGTFDLDVKLGAEGLEDAKGRIDLELGGTVEAGLPHPRPLSATATALRQEREHVVVSGDTLSGIAQRYGVTLAQLRERNRLTRNDDYVLQVGKRLRIPGEESSLPASASRPSGESGARAELSTARVGIDLESSRVGRDGSLEIKGRASGQLVVTSTELRAEGISASIFGRAAATLTERSFELRRKRGETLTVVGERVSIPVRAELDGGSKVRLASGQEFSPAPGSYAEFTVLVVMDPSGRPRVRELAGVNLLIRGVDPMRFANNRVEVTGEGVLRYTGRIVVRPGGMDVFGEVTVGVAGSDTTPALRINW